MIAASLAAAARPVATPTAAAPASGTLATTPHAEAAAMGAKDLVGGRVGGVSSETLPNGVRIIVADRPGAASTKIQLGIGAGSMQDPQGKLGAAHLLEHLAFEGSPTHSGFEQEKLRGDMGNVWNAYTDQDSIVYYGVVPNKDATKAASLITDMFQHPNLRKDALEQERAAVTNEIINGRPNGTDDWDALNHLIYGDDPRANNIIGTPESIDAITAKDLKAYHDTYFTGRNTVVLVEGDKRHLPLETLRTELGKLPAGARVDNASEPLTVEPGKAIQVLPGKDTNAVQLTLALPVDRAAYESIDPLRRKLVANSISDVLNVRMRRDHDLTYGARASFEADPGADHAILLLETTVSPANVQAATRDLFAIAQDSRDGFGPKTLQAHKREVVARLQQREPSTDTFTPPVGDVAEQAFQDALLAPGVSIGSTAPITPRSARAQKAAFQKDVNRLRAVTNEQFAKLASTLVDLSDAKVMVVGDATAADIRAGMRDAGIDTAGVKVLDPVLRR